MKHVLTTLAIFLISSGVFAQDKTKFNKTMKATLMKLSEAKTTEDYQSIANQLDRISKVETEQWEPVYYLALVKAIQTFETEDKAAAANELKDLEPRMGAILGLEPVTTNKEVQSEIYSLMGMMYTARMMENPMALGAKFSPLRDEQLARAEAAYADNPRLWLLRAQNLFYTPEAFGGDKKKAKLLAEKALQLFQLQEKEDRDMLPRWGKNQAKDLIKKMSNKK